MINAEVQTAAARRFGPVIRVCSFYHKSCNLSNYRNTIQVILERSIIFISDFITLTNSQENSSMKKEAASNIIQNLVSLINSCISEITANLPNMTCLKNMIALKVSWVC